ncbi:MAG: MaoC family dehydratase [Candidatus Baltobacteraceae bacterium]|jgi:acyl dehydratase
MGDSVPFSPGQTVSLTRAITAEDVDAFARATGDTNPLHLDEAYAAKTRFKHRIAHGMFVASFISQLLGTRFPGEGTIYMSQDLQFLKPVYLGDTVEVIATLLKYRADKAIMSFDTAIFNQRGEKVLGGEAVCLVTDVFGAQERYKRATAAAG